MRYLFPVLLLGLPAVANAATPIAGRWLTEDGNAVVAISACSGKLCGRVERVLKAPPGATGRDSNNPDPALRARPMVGVPILSNFADAGADWRGRIYNPQDGKSYNSIVARQANGTLKVKGCISIFCKTQVWRPA